MDLRHLHAGRAIPSIVLKISMLATLVLNAGSSSLKFSLFETGEDRRLAGGIVQRLDTGSAKMNVEMEWETCECIIPGAGILEATGKIIELVAGNFLISAIGHRVVHGGDKFDGSCQIDEGALAEIRRCGKLAPLHNPSSAQAIEDLLRRYPSTPQVAVFDTAFHHTLPPAAYHYAIPYVFYEKHRVRRYGFHGTSHAFVAEQTAVRLGVEISRLNAITVHLGNGCSACSIRCGKSVDTTMGLTPLEGLVMGSRSGDVDPSLPAFLAECENLSLAEIHDLLNQKSGLLGLSGLSNDMRTLEAAEDAGNERARLAIDVFCHRLAKAILSMAASLETIDALVFTGGIGENSQRVRCRTLAQLQILGIRCDPLLNASHGALAEGRITSEYSSLPAFVVATNEELVIARETSRVLGLSNLLGER